MPVGDGVRVSIVVTARERFSMTVESLDDLYTSTDVPFDLVYVDVRSPRRVRDALRRAAVRRGFELVRVEQYVSPNAARNIGVGYCDREFVVFVDNDVTFEHGWLEELIACADETGGWVVGPLYLEHGLNGPLVHMAGGDMQFSGEWGAREFVQTQRYFQRPLAEVPEDSLVRQPCSLIEFHCAIIRREVFEKVGLLDEELLTTREHLDYCLRVLDVGGTVWFEPASVITYHTPPPFALSDLPYFLLRWSDEWTASTLQHFAEKYGIKADYVERVAKTRARRQHLLLAAVRPDRRPRLGRVAARVLAAVEPAVNALLSRALTRVGVAASAARAASG